MSQACKEGAGNKGEATTRIPQGCPALRPNPPSYLKRRSTRILTPGWGQASGELAHELVPAARSTTFSSQRGPLGAELRLRQSGCCPGPRSSCQEAPEGRTPSLGTWLRRGR